MGLIIIFLLLFGFLVHILVISECGYLICIHHLYPCCIEDGIFVICTLSCIMMSIIIDRKITRLYKMIKYVMGFSGYVDERWVMMLLITGLYRREVLLLPLSGVISVDSSCGFASTDFIGLDSVCSDELVPTKLLLIWREWEKEVRSLLVMKSSYLAHDLE